MIINRIQIRQSNTTNGIAIGGSLISLWLWFANLIRHIQVINIYSRQTETNDNEITEKGKERKKERKKKRIIEEIRNCLSRLSFFIMTASRAEPGEEGEEEEMAPLIALNCQI